LHYGSLIQMARHPSRISMGPAVNRMTRDALATYRFRQNLQKFGRPYLAQAVTRNILVPETEQSIYQA
jgi:hypothetical protein